MKVSAPFFKGTVEFQKINDLIGGFRNDIPNDILREKAIQFRTVVGTQ